MTGVGLQLPILIPASTMFSVYRERPFFPIVAIQNCLFPGPEVLSLTDATDDPSPPIAGAVRHLFGVRFTEPLPLL